MPELPHLLLRRAEYELPRKKKPGFGRSPDKDPSTHASSLSNQITQTLARFRARRATAAINPDLILRVKLESGCFVDEETWGRCNLTVLSIDDERTLVLFANDQDLTEFQRRLEQYRTGPQGEHRHAPYNQIFSSIAQIGEVGPEDRIGRLFRANQITSAAQIDVGADYVVDVELWDLGRRQSNTDRVREVRVLITARGGSVTDEYIGDDLVLIRVKCKGQVIRELLDMDSVAVVDLPPESELGVAEDLQLGVSDFPPVSAPPDDAASVAILDTGIAAAHPFLGPAIGESMTAPRSLGDAADVHGHGTRVAGLALYGDVEECINSRVFAPKLKIFSARVLNAQRKFDNERLITSQMREAVSYFRTTYGCRVFNLSLGDKRLPYNGGKLSIWAAILDSLARELDVVIVVSAGNFGYDASAQGSLDAHLHHYPRYLLDNEARIIEPATGCVVLTVGALSHTGNVPTGARGDSVAFQPIALRDQPSPFTRSGFGLGGAIKPELCEIGGNLVYDGAIRHDALPTPELSVISLNREYLTRLFSTGVGTSLAAPRVAHAAARLFHTFPDRSANLIRALLAASAKVPAAAETALRPLGDNAVLRVCGYGRPDLNSAANSDENRVVLFADSQLEFDKFHIYEVPIPDELLDTDGTRSITVCLAYDPPVRHTRIDYLGATMSFRLIRGKTVQEIAEAFRSRTEEEGAVDRLSSTTFDCHMNLNPQLRENSTLQKATFAMRRRPQRDYGDTYHLVIRCERKWAGDELGPQRYAAVVIIEHTAQVNLYARIRERVQPAIRIRAGTA